MTKSVRLRPLTGRERRILRAKLGDLSLAVRIHQRYRIIDEVRKGRSVLDAADRVGCHFTIAYDLGPAVQCQWVTSFEQPE